MPVTNYRLLRSFDFKILGRCKDILKDEEMARLSLDSRFPIDLFNLLFELIVLKAFLAFGVIILPEKV